MVTREKIRDDTRTLRWMALHNLQAGGAGGTFRGSLRKVTRVTR
jgi:hypothetical protein